MRGVIFLRGAVAIVVACAVASCGGPAKKADEGGVPTITFWRTLTGPAGNEIDELVQRFASAHRDVRIKSVFKGSYDEIAAALMVSASRGSGPDVALVGTFEIRQFADAGLLEDLKPLMDGPDGVNTAGWPATLRAAGEVGNGLYWVPFNVSVPVLYLNETALKEAGLQGPPATWEQFFDYARKLTRRDASGNVTRRGLSLWDITWPLLSAIWSEGGEVTSRDYTQVTLDDPATVELMRQFQSLMKDGAADMPAQATGGQRNAFVHGKAVMILDSPAPMRDFFQFAQGKEGKEAKFRPMVAQYPVGKKGRVYAPGGGGLVVLKTDETARLKAAWEFVKFMLEDRQVADFAMASGYLAYSDGARALAKATLDANPPLKVVQDGAKYIRGDFSINWSPGVRAALDESVRRILVRGEDPAVVLREADEKAEREVARERAKK
jgi:sn-glycerol 3-phosphate transport system substrate-binding protein